MRDLKREELLELGFIEVNCLYEKFLLLSLTDDGSDIAYFLRWYEDEPKIIPIDLFVPGSINIKNMFYTY